MIYLIYIIKISIYRPSRGVFSSVTTAKTEEVKKKKTVSQEEYTKKALSN